MSASRRLTATAGVLLAAPLFLAPAARAAAATDPRHLTAPAAPADVPAGPTGNLR